MVHAAAGLSPAREEAKAALIARLAARVPAFDHHLITHAALAAHLNVTASL